MATGGAAILVWGPGGAAILVWGPGGAAFVVWGPGSAAVVLWGPGGAAVVVWGPGNAAVVVWGPGGAAVVVWGPGCAAVLVWCSGRGGSHVESDARGTFTTTLTTPSLQEAAAACLVHGGAECACACKTHSLTQQARKSGQGNSDPVRLAWTLRRESCACQCNTHSFAQRARRRRRGSSDPIPTRLEPPARVMRRAVGVAEPLHGADGDGAIECARPQRQPMPHIMQTHVAVNFALHRHVKHCWADVQAHPHVALRGRAWPRARGMFGHQSPSVAARAACRPARGGGASNRAGVPATERGRAGNRAGMQATERACVCTPLCSPFPLSLAPTP
eukprot:350593-Chlamydomonas_euryale.AAC.5